MANLFEAAVERVTVHIPKFEVRYKNESWSSKVIAVLVWLFNRNYMRTYTTTRYPRVYFPTREFVTNDPKRAVKILAHEFVHLWDRKTKGVWFTISYALPQLFLFLAILIAIVTSFFLPWWVTVACSVLCVLCVLPLPAYWRMEWELRGYTMNLAVNFWRYGSINPSTVEWIAKQFTGWGYYKMWPFKADMLRRLENATDEIKAGHLGWPFPEIKQFVREHEAEFK